MIDSIYQLLAKVGYTDPLHAPVTHIPIGLGIGAFLFFLVAIIFNRKQLVLTARHVAILAFIFVFPTILFGVFDWLHFYKGVLLPAIKYKMVLASVVLVVLAVAVIVGSEVKLHKISLVVLYAIAVIAFVGLGWFGGRLVPGVYAAAAQPVAQETPTATGSGGATQPAAAQPAAARTAAQRGQAIFSDNCVSCHPNGGNVVDAKLPLKSAPQLDAQDHFIAFIRAPHMPDGSGGAMPAFPSDQITDAQAGDLYGYITSMVPTWK